MRTIALMLLAASFCVPVRAGTIGEQEPSPFFLKYQYKGDSLKKLVSALGPFLKPDYSSYYWKDKTFSIVVSCIHETSPAVTKRRQWKCVNVGPYKAGWGIEENSDALYDALDVTANDYTDIRFAEKQKGRKQASITCSGDQQAGALESCSVIDIAELKRAYCQAGGDFISSVECREP